MPDHGKYPNAILQKPNNERMKATSYFDLRLEKEIRWRKIRFFFFTEIYNVFDTTNILWQDGYGLPGGRLADISAWDMGRRMQLGLIVSM